MSKGLVGLVKTGLVLEAFEPRNPVGSNLLEGV